MASSTVWFNKLYKQCMFCTTDKWQHVKGLLQLCDDEALILLESIPTGYWHILEQFSSILWKSLPLQNNPNCFMITYFDVIVRASLYPYHSELVTIVEQN